MAQGHRKSREQILGGNLWLRGITKAESRYLMGICGLWHHKDGEQIPLGYLWPVASQGIDHLVGNLWLAASRTESRNLMGNLWPVASLEQRADISWIICGP